MRLSGIFAEAFNREVDRLMINHVIIQPTTSREYELYGGDKVYLVTPEETETDQLKYHSGKVIKSPTSLNYQTRELKNPNLTLAERQYINNRSVHFDVPIEIKDGDEVYFRGVPISRAQYYMKTFPFEVRDEVYADCISIRYDMLYVAIRDLNIITLNGICLAEPRVKEHTVDTFRPDYVLGESYLRYIGCKVKHYAMPIMNNKTHRYLHEWAEDCTTELLPGQMVWHEKRRCLPVAPAAQIFHEELEGLIMLHQKDIFGVKI